MIIKNFLSKNFKNLMNIPHKLISNNRDQRIATGKKRLAKEKERQKISDIKIQLKEELCEKIQDKYEKKYTNFLDQICKTDKQLETAKSMYPEVKNLYYIPLKEEDKTLLKYFDEVTQKLINEGGRIQLYLSVKKNNTDNSSKKIDFNFIPLSINEIQELEYEFERLLEDDEIYSFIIQEGKAIYDEIMDMKRREMDNLFNLVEIAIKEKSSFDLDDEIEVPFNTEIAIDFKNIPDPYYVKIIFANKVVKSKQEMNDIFKKKYSEFYENIDKFTKTNETLYLDKIESELESTFFLKIKYFLQNVKKNKLIIRFDEDNKNFESSSLVFHNILIKGVNVNRSKNGQPFDYIYVDNHENEGIRYYMHKYFAGYAQRYSGIEKSMTSYVKLKEDPSFLQSFNYEMKKKNKQLILRSYFFIKHPFKMQLTDPNPRYFDMPQTEFNQKLGEIVDNIKQQESILDNKSAYEKIQQFKLKEKFYSKESGKPKDYLTYQDNYTHNHLAIFENQLISPPETYLVNHGFEEWYIINNYRIARHKYDPNNWKMVDIDNYMKGNPFFINWDNEFDKEFEKTVKNLNENVNPYDQINLTSYEKTFDDIKTIDDDKQLPITPENLNLIINSFNKKLFQLYSSHYDMIKLAYLNNKIIENELTSLIDILNIDYAKYESIFKDLKINFAPTLKKLYSGNFNSESLKILLGPYDEAFREIIKKSDDEVKHLVIDRKVPVGERLIKLKEMLEAISKKSMKNPIEDKISKEVVSEKSQKNEEAKLEKLEETKDKSQKKGKKEKEKEKVQEKEKDMTLLKTTWPRLEKSVFNEIRKDFTEEQFDKEFNELFINPLENETNISTEKKYSYLFDDQIPTIPSNAIASPINSKYLKPMSPDKFQERPYKNKLEEAISRKIKDRIFAVIKKNQFPPS